MFDPQIIIKIRNRITGIGVKRHKKRALKRVLF